MNESKNIENITPFSQNITPIEHDDLKNNQDNKFDELKPQPPLDDFIKSLPNWDLTPPYETVRRITRI